MLFRSWLGGSGSVRGTDQDRFVYTSIGWSVPRTRLQEEVGTRAGTRAADSGQERIGLSVAVACVALTKIVDNDLATTGQCLARGLLAKFKWGRVYVADSDRYGGLHVWLGLGPHGSTRWQALEQAAPAT